MFEARETFKAVHQGCLELVQPPEAVPFISRTEFRETRQTPVVAEGCWKLRVSPPRHHHLCLPFPVSCSPLMNYSQSMDWLGILGLFVGVIGTFIGIFGAAWGIWQWLDSKQKGDVMIGFLHGLKTGELNPLQLEQVNDMLARFDPPRKARCLAKRNTAGSS